MDPLAQLKVMQAKHIPDLDMLRTIERIRRPMPMGDYYAVLIWDLEAEYPALPPKVVAAKVRALVKKGLIDACTCGCRADIVIESAGEELLASAAPASL